MSGSLGFISSNDFEPSFQEGTDFANNQYDVRAKRNVDQAIRVGVGNMLQDGGSAGYQAPGTSQGAGSPDYSDLAAPPAAPPPTGTPTIGANAAPAPSPKLTLNSSDPGIMTSATPTTNMDPGILAQSPSGFSPDPGMSVAPTAGQAAWSDAPPAAAGTRGARNNNPLNIKYAGQPSAVGTDGTFAQFQTPGAGMQAGADLLGRYADMGITTLRQAITRWAPPSDGNPTDQYVQFVAQRAGINPDAPIDLHDPAVQQAILPHMATFESGSGGGAAPSGGVQQAGFQPSQMPAIGMGAGVGQMPSSNFSARYDPILQQLSQTPGGGAAALQILGSQSRYDMQTNKRQDQYQRLAMQAFAKGDVQTGQYFAQAGGLHNLPPWFGQNMAATRTFAIGSQVAERLYKGDPAGAARFTQAFMKTNDAGQAFQMAGPPADRQNLSIQQVYDAETGTYQTLGIQKTGPTAGTVVQPQLAGAPLRGDPKPVPGRMVSTMNPDGTSGYSLVNPTGPNAGTSTPVTGQTGAPVQAGVHPGQSQARYNLAIQAGLSPQDASAVAAGIAVSGNALATAYRSFTSGLNMDPKAMNLPPPQKQALVEQRMDAAFGPGWRQQMRSSVPAAPSIGAGAQAPAPAPAAAPAPAPAAAPPAARPQVPPNLSPNVLWSPSRRMWKDPATGQTFDVWGQPVGAQPALSP